MNKYTILLPLLLIIVNPGFAQQTMIGGSGKQVSESEANMHASMLSPHSTGLLNNYDLKYHRFRWLVDPDQQHAEYSI